MLTFTVIIFIAYGILSYWFGWLDGKRAGQVMQEGELHRLARADTHAIEPSE